MSRRDLIPATAATPSLLVEFQYEVRYEQEIDLVAFFSSLGESGRADYLRFVTENDQGYLEWEWPVAYISNWVCEDLYVETSLPQQHTSEQVDIEPDYANWVRHMTGDVEPRKRYDKFDAGHAEHLLAKVPWMAATHKIALGQEVEENAAELARIPGPRDVPLFEED